ncbi:hypothetical protein EZJ55_17700 [Microcystis aeruginosa EAWAG127a]|uniref:Uncharacterized protein n=1 Tax=Microcystis aeruginosa EAWAG127a TaxID=2529855 RepID=A0A5J5LWV6_MICAE|nr:hypothetical protein EZJ55_17700 [Microcystis aeruginosa EAWAG127a]
MVSVTVTRSFLEQFACNHWVAFSILAQSLIFQHTGELNCLSALLDLVGKMYPKTHFCWRGSERNQRDTEDTKIDQS